jgi:hypothetical protein
VTRARQTPSWALGLAVALVAGAAWRARHAIDHGAFLSTDERAYSALGVAISHGHYDPPGMDNPLHWPPGTPLLFGAARQLTGAAGRPLDPAAAYAAQVIVGVLLIVVVFVLVRMLTGPWPAVAAAAAVALYPPLAVISGDMVSEPLGALTIAVVMLALARAWRSPSPWRFALAGAATGAAILVRADLLVLPLVLAVVVALTLRRSGARPALLAAGAYLLAAVLALAPWSIYASGRRAQLTPVTSSSWSALYVGTSLPGDGRIFGLREALGDEARRHNPNIATSRTATCARSGSSTRSPPAARTSAARRRSGGRPSATCAGTRSGDRSHSPGCSSSRSSACGSATTAARTTPGAAGSSPFTCCSPPPGWPGPCSVSGARDTRRCGRSSPRS